MSTREIVFENFGSSVTTREVPVPERIDLAKLTKNDPAPQFMTLKVLQAGANSRNAGTGTWTAEAVQNVAEQINSMSIEGGVGHTSPDRRRFDYAPPQVRWIGAVMEGNDLFAKAYIPPYASELRTSMRNAEALGARVGTSVYGTKVRGTGFETLRLESLDIAHPDRLGLPEAAQVPVVTSETLEEEVTEMADATNERDTSLDVILEMFDDVNGTAGVVAAIEGLRNDLNEKSQLVTEVAEALGVDNPDKVVATIETLVAENRQAAQSKVVAEVKEHIKGKTEKTPGLAAIVESMVIGPNDTVLYESSEAATAQVDAVLETKHMKDLIKTMMRQHSGPNSVVEVIGEASDDTDFPIIEYTEEQQDQLAQMKGM